MDNFHTTTQMDDIIHDIMYQIMQKAHRGQYRNDGVTPYDVHPQELADMFYDTIDQAVALGHDVIEDGKKNGVTEAYIRDRYLKASKQLHYEAEQTYFMGVADRLVDSIVNLTHLRHISYDSYIAGIYKANIKYKIMDIYINSTDKPKPHQLIKYQKALKNLASRI